MAKDGRDNRGRYGGDPHDRSGSGFRTSYYKRDSREERRDRPSPRPSDRRYSADSRRSERSGRFDGENSPRKPYAPANQPRGERFGSHGGSRPPHGLGNPPRTAHRPGYPIPPSVQDDRPRFASPDSFQREELPENLLVGRNPIREALKSGQGLEKLLVQEGEISGSAREIVAKAMEAGVVVQHVSKARLDAIYPHHQGMLAYASAHEYADVDEMFDAAAAKNEDPFIVVLDGITDPHNLGAIIRSAECMGATGVIIPQRRSAGLTPAAVKAAAGALSYIPVAKVGNLNRTLDDLKKRGVWVTGAAADGIPVDQLTLTGPIAVVIGAEGEGISPLCRRNCDQLAALPMYGHIESLNASVAAGILFSEIAKARHA